MAEKEHKFIRHLGGTKSEEYLVKESELTIPQKELMIADFIHQFSKLPQSVQERIELQIFYKKYIKIEN